MGMLCGECFHLNENYDFKDNKYCENCGKDLSVRGAGKELEQTTLFRSEEWVNKWIKKTVEDGVFSDEEEVMKVMAMLGIVLSEYHGIDRTVFNQDMLPLTLDALTDKEILENLFNVEKFSEACDRITGPFWTFGGLNIRTKLSSASKAEPTENERDNSSV